MHIYLNKLNYSFKKKPLLVGGMAMEYYGLRKSGADIDFIASQEDVLELIKLYPNRVKDLWGDIGVCPFEFEIWKSICYFDYSYYKEMAIEKDSYLIISLEKLLIMKMLANKKEKNLKDTSLIINLMLKDQGKKLTEFTKQNRQFLKDIKDIVYIEKTGPNK